MSPRDILWLHKHDLHIFRAPAYAELLPGAKPGTPHTSEGPYELLVSHRYSYPALLHLAIFTDIMNIYQDDPGDADFWPRTGTNASRMRVAVKTGLIFFLSCFFLAAVGLGQNALSNAFQAKSTRSPAICVSSMWASI